MSDPIFLNGKSELCYFFGLSDVTIYKAINQDKTILRKKDSLEYQIIKIF